MKLQTSLLLIGALFLSFLASGFSQVQATTAPFQAEYFNNLDFSGNPVLTQDEQIIDFDWGMESPDPSVYPDYFTARFTSTQEFTAEEYTFEVTADDGIRVYVDDELIIDEWKRQPPTTYTVNKTLSGGSHEIRLEYYEFNVGATLAFDWYLSSSPVTPTPTPTSTATVSAPFHATYFNNTDLSGTPVFEEDVPAIEFAWEYDSPHDSVLDDHFSVRWTREESFSEGYYRFVAHADDGIRILVDGELVLDGWKNQGVTEYINYRYMTSGMHTVTVEYYEYIFGATVDAEWQPVTPFALSSTLTEIMPLGDSITHGWNVPGGYRTKLYTDLSQLNMVGTLNDGPATLDDADHEGHPGWRIDEIATNAAGWVSYYKPEIILLMIGTNDIVQNHNVNTMPDRLDDLIGLLSTHTPDAHILVASIPPLVDTHMNEQVAAYNAQIPGVVQSKSDAGVNVLFVDIAAALTLEDIDPDAIHPNAQGYDKIAQKWIEAINQIDTDTDSPTPTPTETLTPTPDSAPDDTYHAQYYNNIDLSGAPVLTRNENEIDNVWGYDSPAPEVRNDFFSARWSRTITTGDEAYTFEVTADDGVRLILDGTIIIDQWKDQGPTTYRTTIDLAAGEHMLIMEYYERWVGAVAKLNWQPASSVQHAVDMVFDAEYYDNINLQGYPRVMSSVEAVDFNFGYGSPHEQIPTDFFSARWTATPDLPAGTYRFSTTTDDGVRLIIDGNTVIDDWNDHGNLTHEIELNLDAGEHTIIMEYYEHWVGAYAELQVEHLEQL